MYFCSVQPYVNDERYKIDLSNITQDEMTDISVTSSFMKNIVNKLFRHNSIQVDKLKKDTQIDKETSNSSIAQI